MFLHRFSAYPAHARHGRPSRGLYPGHRANPLDHRGRANKAQAGPATGRVARPARHRVGHSATLAPVRAGNTPAAGRSNQVQV